MDGMTPIVGIVAFIVGGAAGYFFSYLIGRGKIEQARTEAARIIEEAESQARATTLAAKDDAVKIRDNAQSEVERWRTNLRREEEGLQKRREKLDQRQESLDRREQSLNKRQSSMDKQRNEVIRLQEFAGLGNVSGSPVLRPMEAQQSFASSHETETTGWRSPGESASRS